MRVVLAAIDTSAAAGPVLAVAHAVAALFDATVEAIHVREGEMRGALSAAEGAGVPLRTFDGPPLPTVLSAARNDDVVALVVGARRVPYGKCPGGHMTCELVASLPKPAIVVPPRTTSPGGVGRIVIAMEAVRTSTAPLAWIIDRACAHGIDVVLLHVRDAREVPRFADQAHHEMEAWGEEFVARHCPAPSARTRLEVRVGSAGPEILRAVEEMGVQLLALSWGQSLAADHAFVVRHCLAGSSVPILLIPRAS